MPVRNFAAAVKEASESNPDRMAIELQPNAEASNARTVIIELKRGATKEQAEALNMQLNLLGVRMLT